MQFKVFQESRKGTRHNNQDKIGYVYTNDCLLMIVCDGMGGHARGEIAAQIVVESLAKSFRQMANSKIKDPPNFLSRSLLVAHNNILAFARSQSMNETPRTTCVACLVQDGKAWIAHVGDSRLYLLREGEVLRQTIDHSHVQNLIDQGKITKDQAAVHPDRNKIFNCLGQPTSPRIDVSVPVELILEDKIILCSDGFWGPLIPSFVANSLKRGFLDVNIPILMDLAEVLSGKDCDNLSVVAMSWKSTTGSAKNASSPSGLKSDLKVDDAAVELSLDTILMAIHARKSSAKANLAGNIFRQSVL